MNGNLLIIYEYFGNILIDWPLSENLLSSLNVLFMCVNIAGVPPIRISFAATLTFRNALCPCKLSLGDAK